MEAFVELIKNSGVADKSSKALRQDIYSFITRIGEFLLMGTLDLCIDKQLMSQALRLSREPLIQEVLAQEITKTLGVCENRVRLLSNIETILSHDYYPSPEDILSTRKPTKGGLISESFHIGLNLRKVPNHYPQHLLLRKVSKSRKQIMMSLILPKNEQNTLRILS